MREFRPTSSSSSIKTIHILVFGLLSLSSCILLQCSIVEAAAAAATDGSILMDPSGSLRLNKIPTSTTTDQGIVSIITSPGTKSFFLQTNDNDDNVLSLDSQEKNVLICRGATLKGTSTAERTALAITSVVSNTIIIDGITIGDIHAAGWKNTRHARTLTALFRARLSLYQQGTTSEQQKQTLILCVKSTSGNNDPALESILGQEIRSLFDATVAEAKENNLSFNDIYEVVVKCVSNAEEAKETLGIAKIAATENASSSSSESTVLASLIQDANERIKESGITSFALDPPHIAHAFVAVSNAHTKQSKNARVKITQWKSRALRGLWTDNFGSEAEALRKKILSSFDSETLAAAGLPLVASYRLEMRNQLAALVDTSIMEVFAAQVSNLEKRTLKRSKAQLLKQLDKIPVEDVPSENAAAIRAAMFSFDNIMNDMEVPSLSLTKTKACRDMEAKLTDAVAAFDDSPAAKVKRMNKVKEVASKEKKPGERSVDFGLDLVTVLRPDGFGSFQGFAGYNLGGNMLIFGIHNDADDPATIAQFGGVRPPLLRIQPKLRVDIEM